ncbi:SseB family protein [Arthrobacter sp. H20]|uniref:SseB family protein n=1 Tax=Arthrobacter sp. H20 TaxID=1267981 RepID=UPI000478AB28|nr:SseB family protein [Arthrobacter sp. H20]
MSERHLPAHIAAALAGNSTDSAGQPWAGRDLSGDGNPLHNFDDDDGGAPAAYSAAVDELLAGEGDEAGVLAALADVRVFVPVVAQLAHDAAHDGHSSADHSHGEAGFKGDKQADMALVTLSAPDGRTALPVFSSAAALTAWHPAARPVAVYAPRAALSAVADGAELLVIDPGAHFTFVVRRPAMWALAQQIPWEPAYADPKVADVVDQITAEEQAIVKVELGPGSGVPARAADGTLASGGGPGPEVRLTITLREGLAENAVRAVVQELQDRLRSRREFVERVDSLEVVLTR